MTDSVRLTDLQVERNGELTRLAANVDGDPIEFTVHSELPVRYPLLPFLPPLLQEAMARNVDAVIATDHPLLPSGLPENLIRYQAILTNWNSDDLHPVTLRGAREVTEAPTAATICCFSGGIDSQYSYFCHRDQISHLLVIQGFDQDSSTDEWQRNVAARQAFARVENRRLISVASNLRGFFERRKLSWTLAHGGILGATGGMFAPTTLFIPSSFTCSELFPWGSHPLLDPCWSSDSTRIVHDGLERGRARKTEWLANFPQALDHLQVCWRGVDKNCGNCPKCVRTSVILHLLGKHSASLPAYQHASQLRWLKPGTMASLAFTEDVIDFCRSHDAVPIANTLRRYRRQFLFKYHLAEMMKVLFGRTARALSHRLWPQDWQEYRVRIRAARDYL